MALALLLVALLFQRVLALEQLFNVSEISNGVHVGRSFSLSTKGPTGAALQGSPELQKRVAPGYELFETLAKVVDKRKAVNDSQACNLRVTVTWVGSTPDNIRVRQVGEINDQCNTRVTLNSAAENNEMDPNYVRRVRDTIIDVKKAFFQAQKDIPEIPDKNNQDLNWTRAAFIRGNWDLERSGQTCTSDNLFAYRKNGEWYLQATITNSNVDAFLPDWERQYITELIPKNFSDPMKLRHVKHDNHSVIEEGTTIIAKWGGKVELSDTSNMVFDENPALVEALRLNAIAVDQAEDAVTPSNIAILALPMVMSLIPVAFLADLNTCAMLWYIVFTDVFSAVPFLIKGIELLDSTTTKRGEIVAYHMGNETLSQMEVWAAECKGRDSFRVLGILFICIAVFAITFGVLLEMVAARVMRRRRVNKGHEASGPFGMAMFDTTAYSPLGAAEEDERDRRLSEELGQEARYSYEQGQPNGDAEGNHGAVDGPVEGGESAPQGRPWWAVWRRNNHHHPERGRGSDERGGGEIGAEVSVPALAASSDEEWENNIDSTMEVRTVLGTGVHM